MSEQYAATAGLRTAEWLTVAQANGLHPLGVAVTHLGRIAGYTGITSEYVLTDRDGTQHRALELGGAVVMAYYRRKGLASAMLHNLVDTMRKSDAYPDGTRVVAFTNPRSRGYIEKAGLAPLDPAESLSVDAFELCRDCTQCPTVGLIPWKDPKTCCDYGGIRAIEL